MTVHSIKDPTRLAAYRRRKNAHRAELRRRITAKEGLSVSALRWTQYPTVYLNLLQKFQTDGLATLPGLTRKQATAVRAKFYRLRTAVLAASRSGSDFDPMLPDLIDAFIDLSITITEDLSDGTFTLQLTKDPALLAAERAKHATEPLNTTVETQQSS